MTLQVSFFNVVYNFTDGAVTEWLGMGSCGTNVLQIPLCSLQACVSAIFACQCILKFADIRLSK